MVDQTTPAPPPANLFRVRPNLSLDKYLEILNRIDLQSLTGDLYGEELASFENQDKLTIKAQVKREQQISDLTLFSQDLAFFLFSLYQDLQTKKEFNQLLAALNQALEEDPTQVVEALTKAILELENFIKDKNGLTFPDDITDLRQLIGVLKVVIRGCQNPPAELEAFISTESEEKTKQPASLSSPATTAGVSSQAGSDGEAEGDIEAPDQTTQPQASQTQEQLSRAVKDHKAVQIHAGFLYNHVMIDLANLYGLDQSLLLNLPPEIQQKIRGQIVANLYSFDAKSLTPAERLKLEKQILFQILVGNPGLTLQIQQYLLTNENISLTEEQRQRVEQMDDLAEKFGVINASRSLSLRKDLVINDFTEDQSAEDFDQTNRRQTAQEIEAELLASINQLDKKYPDGIVAANISQVIDSRILTQQNPAEIESDQMLLDQLRASGLEIKEEDEAQVKQAIEIYWYKKLAVYSKVVGAVDEDAGSFSLTLADDLSDQERAIRQQAAGEILSQKRPSGAASFVAYHLPGQAIEDNQEKLAQASSKYLHPDAKRIRAEQFVLESLRQQELYQKSLEEKRQAELADYSPAVIIQHRYIEPIGNDPADLGRDISPSVAAAQIENQRISQAVAASQQRRWFARPENLETQLGQNAQQKMATNMAAQAALAKLAQAIPQARIAMMVLKHRKLIIAAVIGALIALLMLLLYLLQFLTFLVGLLVLGPGLGAMVYSIWGREGVEKVGRFSVEAAQNVFSPSWWSSNLSTAGSNIATGATAIAKGTVLIPHGAAKYLWGQATGARASTTTTLTSVMTPAQAAVGGTVAATGTAALIVATATSPFLQPLGEHEVDINLAPKSEITIRKTNDGASSLQPGQTITYTLKIENNTSEGTNPITEINIKDSIASEDQNKINPNSFALISSIPGLNCQQYQNFTLTCSISQLNWNESLEIVYSVETVSDSSIITPDGETSVRNLAQVQGLLDGEMVSDDSRNTANGGSEEIAMASEEITGGLIQAWWGYYNYHTQAPYSKHFNLGIAPSSGPWGATGAPLPCTNYGTCPDPGTNDGHPEILFWCTWNVIYSYDEAGKSLASPSSPGSLLSVYYMRAHFIKLASSGQAEYVGVSLSGTGSAPTADQVQVGDVAFFGKSGGSTSAHVAIVKHVDSSRVVTLDSNNWKIENTYTVGSGGRIEPFGKVTLNGVGRLN